ncbi:MAG: hypothetical protein QXO40_00210 [Candidatus Aenigmatarchaeota archaeon]
MKKKYDIFDLAEYLEDELNESYDIYGYSWDEENKEWVLFDKNFAYFIVEPYDAETIKVILFSKWWNIGAIWQNKYVVQWTIFTEKELEETAYELKDIVIEEVKDFIDSQVPCPDCVLLELIER